MSLWKRLFGKAIDPVASMGSSSAITGTFNLSAQLAGQSGRSIGVQCYMYDGESKESVESRIDLLQEIIERQRVRCEIPELEAKREQMVKGLQQAADVLDDLQKRQKNGENLSSQERLNMRNLATNIGKMKEEVDKGTAAIQDARKKAGVR